MSTAELPEWVSADLTRAMDVARWHPEAGAEELASILYSYWYAPAERIDLADGGRPPLFGEYRAAHAGSNSFVEAEVAGLAPGGIVLATAGLDRPRALLPGDYCQPAGSDRAGLPPRIGERVLIVRRQDAPPAEGWWRSWGGGWRPADPPSTLSRIYLAADPDRVLELIGRLTGLLLERTEPWLLKAPADRAALGRPDAVVVYLPSAELGPQPDSNAVISGLASCAAGLVRDVRPALALGLAPGLALAEDPIGEESFGEWVSGLVADALVSVGRDDADVGLARMVAELSAAGLDPARPYVRPEVRP